jgi:hypothetical protein
MAVSVPAAIATYAPATAAAPAPAAAARVATAPLPAHQIGRICVKADILVEAIDTVGRSDLLLLMREKRDLIFCCNELHRFKSCIIATCADNVPRFATHLELSRQTALGMLSSQLGELTTTLR